jgi:hypothetical protein
VVAAAVVQLAQHLVGPGDHRLVLLVHAVPPERRLQHSGVGRPVRACGGVGEVGDEGVEAGGVLHDAVRKAQFVGEQRRSVAGRHDQGVGAQ